MDADTNAILTACDELIASLRQDPDDESVIARLIELAKGPSGGRVRDHLDAARKEQFLETQWALEDILEAVAPKKAEPEAPEEEEAAEEPEEDDPNRPLTAADLNLVYDDPRGLMLYKSKRGERWFATQVDPRSGQPQTFELHPQEIEQLQTQLAGSPYWLIGG